ncbi:MAG: NAD(P)H-binding protein [Roseburia sp.]|nr:NAD(P)H-binding protein [Roseburia sp.]
MLAVTGITGHTGYFFLNELVASEYQGRIKCLVRTTAKAEHVINSGLDVELVEGNLDDEESVRSLFWGAEVVVHIANIHYSPMILRIGKECGIKRFILVHTTGIYSKFKSASQDYIDIENQIKTMMQELNVTILRPTMIFGDINDYNISKFIRFVDRLPILPIVDGGEALIQPVNARDLGNALYRALFADVTFGKAYDLSGERALSIRQLYLLIADALGKKRVIISVPMGLCVVGAIIIRCVTFGKLDLIEKVQRMGENRCYSHQSAFEDFGYNPEKFEIGLRREVDEYIASK